MKKFLLFIGLFCTANLYAQNEKVTVETGDDGTQIKIGRSENVSIQESDGATRIRVGNTEINVAEDDVHINFWKERISKNFRGHWAGIELGMNGYVNKDYSGYNLKNFMDLRTTKSLSVRINFLQLDWGIQKDNKHMGILTGLGLESRDYRFEKNYTIQDINGVTQPKALVYDKIKKSKLNILYVTIPLIFEMQFPDKNEQKFHIGFGVEGGWRIASHTKIKYKDGGSWEKTKDRDNFNLNNFKLDAQVRMGYRGLHLFFNYGLVKLFQKDKGPELTPFTVGLTLLSF